jgi:hypothetical protein
LLQPLVNIEKPRLTAHLRPQRRPGSSNHETTKTARFLEASTLTWIGANILFRSSIL